MNQETMKLLFMATGIEVAIVILLAGIFIFLRMKKGKKADQKAAEELVKNVKKNEKGRRESLLQVFGECYDMEQEELEAAVDEFLNREKAFYKTLISVYVNRDASEFSKLSGSLEEMVKPYADLALSADLSVDSEELEALQRQNQSLEKELEESKKVMDELLAEYTATFDKKGEGKVLEVLQKDKENTPEEANKNSDTGNTSDESSNSITEPVTEQDDDMEGTLELTVESVLEAEAGTEESVSEVDTDQITEETDQVSETTDESNEKKVEVEAELAIEQDSEEEEVVDLETTSENVVALDEFDEEIEPDLEAV